MARRRHLAPEEEAQWQAVARTAQPLHLQKAPIQHPGAVNPPSSRPPEQTGSVQMAPQPFRIGEKAGAAHGQAVLPNLSAGLFATPLRMDAKTFARMSRGKLAPEALIDLHGLTLAEAHPELIRFILGSQARGLRLVLVITGKGRRAADDGPVPQRHGVLKHHVPQWLSQAPLGAAVQQVAGAAQRHGGGGALYVYLQKRR